MLHARVTENEGCARVGECGAVGQRPRRVVFGMTIGRFVFFFTNITKALRNLLVKAANCMNSKRFKSDR